MRKPRLRCRLLLDKEIIKILTATDKVAGGRLPYTPSNPPEDCVNTSQKHNC